MEQLLNVKYYISGKALPFDETRFIEFKGHRSLCVDEIPPQCMKTLDETSKRTDGKHDNSKSADMEKNDWWLAERCFRRGFKSRQSRQPVSKTINAFLNSGHGGIVLLGITDDGIVRGIKLTQYQKDHVKISLRDCLERFNPPVPKTLYKLRFILVLEKPLTDVNSKTLDFKYPVDPNVRKMPHLLRSYKYCWCDNDAKALIAMGIMPPSYVIEIAIFPWNKPSLNDVINEPAIGLTNTDTSFDNQFCPIYETEDRKCCFKRTASVVSHTKQQVYDITVQEVRRYCQREIFRQHRGSWIFGHGCLVKKRLVPVEAFTDPMYNLQN